MPLYNRIPVTSVDGDTGAVDLSGTYAPMFSRADLPPGVYGAYPKNMANPPTVTPGVANAATAIASARAWDPGGGSLTFVGSDMAYGQAFPDTWSVTPKANAGTNNNIGALVIPQWRVAFYTDAAQFEIWTKGTATAIRVIVDNEFVTADGAATITRAQDGSGYRDLVDFTAVGGSKMRLIEIDFAPSSRLYGIVTGPTDTVVPAPRRRRISVMGDSFTEGTGATSPFRGFATSLAMALGGEPWVSGLGATGYLNPSNAPKVKLRDRIQNDVLRYPMDGFVWANGLNDYASYAAVATATEAALCWDLAMAASPKAWHVVIGPFWRNGPSTYPVALLDLRDALEAKAAEYGFLFVDPLELDPAPILSFSTTLASGASATATTISTVARPSTGSANGAGMVIEIGAGATRERQPVVSWTGGGPYTCTTKALASNHSAGQTVTVVGRGHWSGTGKVGATQGDGNSDILVASDGTHPSQAGHDALWRMLFGQIAVNLPL